MTVKKPTGEEVLTTSCKNCVFAEYIGDTQVSCQLNRIDKFRSRNAVVMDAEDDDKEFFVIERFCNTYRDSDWKDILFYYKTDTTETPEERVKKEIEIRCGFFLTFSDENTLKELEESISSITDQIVTPTYVTIVDISTKNTVLIDSTSQPMDTQATHFVARLSQGLDGKDIVYNYIRGTDEERRDLSAPELVDMAFKRTARNGYYTVFKIGDKIPSHYLSAINHYINEELNQVILIKQDDNINGYFAQSSVHKLVYGSNGKYIVDKLEELTEEQNLPHLITNWSNVEELYEISACNDNNS